MEREYIRDKTLEGHEAARAPREVDRRDPPSRTAATLAAALHLRDQELSLREIAERLATSTGKKKGQHPSAATVMRTSATTMRKGSGSF